MSDRASTTQLQALLDAYLNGETGVRFEALAHFADPLFDLYNVDPREVLGDSPEERSRKEVGTMLSVMETARILWAYCALSPDERAVYRSRLEARLIGERADPEDQAAFRDLLTLMQSRWNAMPPHLHAKAEDVPGFASPSFEQLLQQFEVEEPTGPSQDRQARYGPDQLAPPEALALFAQPLLDDPDTRANPDALEAGMARVDAYWELAHLSAEQQDAHLVRIKARFASTDEERARIEDEARRMIEHFNALFPEKAR